MKYLFFHYQQVLLLFFVTTITCAQEQNTHVLQGLGQSIYHHVPSSQSKSTYHIIVRLPDGYDKSIEYPTIYLLDGGISYPLLSAYYHYLRFTEEIPAMIIVGISYGTDDWKKGNARSFDYTVKSPQREHWGGAEKFQYFIKNSVIPLVENNYSSAPDSRIIFGNSLAGQFVLYTAMTQPDLFAGHIASNPALHQNVSFFLNEKNIEHAVNYKSKLYVSSGSNDDVQFREPVKKWIKHWENKSSHPWILKTETLNDEGHMSAIPQSFVRGVRWVLNFH